MNRIIEEFSKAEKLSDLSIKLSKEQLKLIKSKDLIFQAMSWYGADFQDLDADESGQADDPLSYQIYIHGRLLDKTSVCLRMKNFHPYFYIEVPENWNYMDLEKLKEAITRKLWKNSYALVSVNFEQRKKLYPFTNGKLFKFAKIVLKNEKAH